MSYREALQSAGATVLAFGNFGSYQGDWWAKVSYEGKDGWANGSFGSCSGCDAFEAEFGSYHAHDDGDYYNPNYSGYKENCETCQNEWKRFIEFGRRYLVQILSQQDAEKEAAKNISWDCEADNMLKFIQNNSW